MNISAKGIALLKEREELRLQAYKDTGGVWTIGWGHTKGVSPTDTCTEVQAEAWLRSDFDGPENAINAVVRVPLTQSMFDALVVFVFNVGVMAFKDSILLTDLNAKRYFNVPGQLCRWHYDDGKELRGLMIRRLKEALLFMDESW